MTIKDLFSRTPVTALLLTSFIVLFIIQIASGVDINSPSADALTSWGANVFPLTLGPEPWRLISSAFLHIGLMHLLFNSFAIYYFGQAAEITFGSVKFLLLFIVSAIGGNLLKVFVTWYSVPEKYWDLVLSAGASGGIMGLGMALLMVELLKHSLLKYPNKGANTQLKSLALIMGINLLYGFAIPGIDNAAHIGGALTGAVIALGIMLSYRYAPIHKNSLFKHLPILIFAIISVVFFKLWLDLHLQFTPIPI